MLVGPVCVWLIITSLSGTFLPVLYKRRLTQNALTALQLLAWLLVISVNIYLIITFEAHYDAPYPDVFLQGQFKVMYYGYVSILIYSMVTIPLMSIAVSGKLFLATRGGRQTDGQTGRGHHRLLSDKKFRATIMTLYFALCYVLFYIYSAIYYTLPLLDLCSGELGDQSFSLSNSTFYLSSGNSTLQFYCHWWLYYSCFTASTVNCVVHFVCNSMVKRHLAGVRGRLRGWWRGCSEEEPVVVLAEIALRKQRGLQGEEEEVVKEVEF